MKKILVLVCLILMIIGSSFVFGTEKQCPEDSEIPGPENEFECNDMEDECDSHCNPACTGYIYWENSGNEKCICKCKNKCTDGIEIPSLGGAPKCKPVDEITTTDTPYAAGDPGCEYETEGEDPDQQKCVYSKNGGVVPIPEFSTYGIIAAIIVVGALVLWYVKKKKK